MGFVRCASRSPDLAGAHRSRKTAKRFANPSRHRALTIPNPSLDDNHRPPSRLRESGSQRALRAGLPDLGAVRTVCAAVAKPVNFTAGIKGKSFSVGELAAAGVKRISLATSLYRAAMTGFLDAARQVRDTGQFNFLDQCVTTSN